MNRKGFLTMGNVYLILALLLSMSFSSLTESSEIEDITSIFLPIITREFSKFAGMAFIPSGEFRMGCDGNNPFERNECFIQELPLHTVYLDDYYIDIYLTTNENYGKCVEAGVCARPHSNSSYTRSSYYGNPIYANYPVVWVLWENADQYCNWIGKRLPTDAEWEKAARGSDTRKFPWGNDATNCSLANSYSCVGDTTEVGSYPLGVSPYGIFDMAGNVKEWVSDWYHQDYYSISPYYNPTGPDSGITKGLRGGSFGSYYLLTRTAFRDTHT